MSFLEWMLKILDVLAKSISISTGLYALLGIWKKHQYKKNHRE